MEFRFTPKQRLLHRWEFKKFFEKCDVDRLGVCVIFRAPSPKNHARLGITIKASTNSVTRNRVKRQIREFFRLHQQSLGAFDFNVVIPKDRDLRYPYARNLRKSLLKKGSQL